MFLRTSKLPWLLIALGWLLLARTCPAQARPPFPAHASMNPANPAPTPPMGWASWNRYFCNYDAHTIRSQARALAASGMRRLGYRYVLIQECIAPRRDAAGRLIVSRKRFPQGMRPLVAYLHSLRLKAGIYTDLGRRTCGGYQGSFGHERQDARTFAGWGADLVEMDYCNRPRGYTGRVLYTRMARALQATRRPMLFYICSWGNERPWTWAQSIAQLWRTDLDISHRPDQVRWRRVVQNFESNARHAVFTAPNSWNDPDMLELGARGLNPEEEQSHFSMWAISAAPLWVSTDLTRISPRIRSLLTNREVIAVDQDPLGAGPVRAGGHDGVQVWAKPLGSFTSGDFAVLLLNLGHAPARAAVRWRKLGIHAHAAVRDLWARRELGVFTHGFSILLPPHGSRLLRIRGRFNWQRGAAIEAEWPGNLRSGATRLLPCGACSRGYALRLGGRHGPGAIEFRRLMVNRTGRYRLQLNFVRHARAVGRIMVSINGAIPLGYTVPQSAWSRLTLPVRLRAGSNAVMIISPNPDGFDLDKIRLHR